MTENKKRYVYHQSRDFGSLIEDTKDNKCLHFMSQATEELNALHEENQQLRELLKIGKTNAKDIVDVLNEQEQVKWEKQEHIVHLENKIHRMREQIKKLEYLYHYRTCEIERLNHSEVDSYKQEITRLEKENEELKEENQSLKSELAHCEEDYIMEEYL